jgi:hypothetical protein
VWLAEKNNSVYNKEIWRPAAGATLATTFSRAKTLLGVVFFAACRHRATPTLAKRNFPGCQLTAREFKKRTRATLALQISSAKQPFITELPFTENVSLHGVRRRWFGATFSGCDVGARFATTKGGSVAQHPATSGLAKASQYFCGPNCIGGISTAGSSSAEPLQDAWAAHLANTRP